MRNVLTIARRELAAMFHSLLAYVFLVLFVFIVQFPFTVSFFQSRQADMGLFFLTLPWCVVVFAPLVSMRSWAEERQANTFEMLLTFPMKDWELVVGKFLSAFAFVALGIACTFALPLMVSSVGDPDRGPILAGYLGALLLAGVATAAGVFFSGLTRSQLLAALVTVAVGLASLLAGFEAVKILLDAQVDGLGSLLASLFGVWEHYTTFTRGVVEVGAVLFFVAWGLVFLYLNALFVGLRRHPSAAAVLSAGLLLAFGCGLMTSRLLAGESLARFDLTEDRIYTLSEGTLSVLRKAEVPVRVRLYVSPRSEMPTQMQDLERRLTDYLQEIKVASKGRIEWSVVHMQAANVVVTPEEEEQILAGEETEAGQAQNLERRMIEKGVRPFPVQTAEATEVSTKLVYATLGIAYREKDEEFLQPFTPAQVPELEPLLAGTVARLVRDRPPRIALHLGAEAVDPQVEQLMRQMGRELPDPYAGVEQLLRQEKFDVVRVKLSQHEPLPEDYDALVVVGPNRLDERQRWEVARALVEGRPTLLAVQRYTWDYRMAGRSIQIVRQDAEPGLEEVLSAQGLGVSSDVLMDENHETLAVNLGGLEALLGGTPVKVPMHVVVLPANMNAESVITQRLPEILYLWGTALERDDQRLAANLLEPLELFTSSERSWTVPGDRRLQPGDLDPRGQPMGKRPLALLVEGQFKDPYAGQPRPKWPVKLEMMPDGRPRPALPDSEERPAEPRPGKLILTGCARMWQSSFLGGGTGNAPLLLNCVNALTLDEDLLRVRAKRAADRRFEKPKEAEALFWTLTPLVIVPLLIVGAGLMTGVGRMRRREQWAQAHGRNR